MKIYFQIIFLLGILTSSLSAENFNWTMWKGPHQTGISDETEWNPEALNSPLKIKWQTNVGDGYSNVSIMGDSIYTMGYDKRNKENVLYCLSVETGRTIWKYAFPGTKGKYEGPKCTPVIDGDRVYILSQDGLMLCNDSKNGKVVWQKDLVEEFGAKLPHWSSSSSVCIEGDMAIVNAGDSGIAINKITGEKVWVSPPGAGNYSTPVTFKIENELYSAIYGQKHLHAVNIKTGKIKWSFPWQTKYNIIAADPYVYGTQIFISSGYENGCALIDFSKREPELLWRNKNLSTHFSTVVILNDFIYGIDGNTGENGELKCLNIKDGSVVWSKELGFASLISANGYLIVLNEKGSLFIVKADPSGYQEISKQEKILDRLCWTAPVLCNATIYLRNDKGDLVSIDVK